MLLARDGTGARVDVQTLHSTAIFFFFLMEVADTPRGTAPSYSVPSYGWVKHRFGAECLTDPYRLLRVYRLQPLELSSRMKRPCETLLQMKLCSTEMRQALLISESRHRILEPRNVP